MCAGKKERVTKSASQCHGFWDIIGESRYEVHALDFWKRNRRPISEATWGTMRQRLEAHWPCQNLLNLDVVAKKKYILQHCGLFRTSNLIRDGFYLVQEKFQQCSHKKSHDCLVGKSEKNGNRALLGQVQLSIPGNVCKIILKCPSQPSLE